MSERLGRERLLEMLLVGAPERLLAALVAGSPQDAHDLRMLCSELSLLALTAEPVTPSQTLRDRILGACPRVRCPRRPVLVVIDMLCDHLTPGRPIEIPRARAIVPALQARLDAARAQSMPVIYVCDSHPADDVDFLEWPVHNVQGTSGAEIWPPLASKPGDIIVPKRSYSAFTQTNFGAVLDQLNADELILTGCATEVQLAATATDALQRGFVVTIPPDCQAGLSQIAEQVTMTVIASMPPFEPRYLRP